jgi:hypothetical protein
MICSRDLRMRFRFLRSLLGGLPSRLEQFLEHAFQANIGLIGQGLVLEERVNIDEHHDDEKEGFNYNGLVRENATATPLATHPANADAYGACIRLLGHDSTRKVSPSYICIGGRLGHVG